MYACMTIFMSLNFILLLAVIQARIMVVVGGGQNFFRMPFSVQISKKCIIYILNK